MLQRVVALGPTVLRYPGGSMSDTYHWKDGIGPLGERRVNEHFFSSRKQVVAMGTQELLELCEATGAAPLITVNTATGSAQDAADWVTYTNRKELVSSRTGKPLPRVRYWEIGNEPYLQDDKRKALWIQPEAFAKKASEFIRAMKRVDPDIVVGIPLRSDKIGGVPATPLPGYNRKVLQLIDVDFDFVALHNAYLPLGFDRKYGDDELYLATAAAASVVEDDFAETRRLLKELRPGKDVKLAVTEYQALYSLGKSTDDYILSPAGALYVAEALRVFAQAGDLMLANFWSLSGNWHFGALDQKGEPRPAYHVLKAYRALLQGRMLPVSVQAPAFDSPRVGLVPARTAVPKVTAIATIDADRVRAIVINKDAAGAATVTLVLPEGVMSVGGTFTSYGGPRRPPGNRAAALGHVDRSAPGQGRKASMSEANRRAQRVVDTLLARHAGLAVLEAGCGSASHLRIPDGARLTGIDISPTQLEHHAGLDERICGDLETHEWPRRQFDMIICWDVLEHLSRPHAALRRMFAAVARGGVVVLAMPNLYSIKGVVTKFTPYWFHVFFYRYVMGDRSPPERFRQFPTYLRQDITPARVRELATAHGFAVEHFDVYEGPVQADLRRRSRLADAAFAFAGAACRALTLGRLDPNSTDMIVVLRYPGD
jgi:alpha-N-arabinofuranosidase